LITRETIEPILVKICSLVRHLFIEFDYLAVLAEFLADEDPDASAPLQVSEDMVEDDISSRYISYNKRMYLGKKKKEKKDPSS
jgi:hypothetical protein